VRDRNDYVKINNGIISYKDNNTQAEFKINDIQSCINNIKTGLELTFKDNSTHLIPLKKMNFNTTDSLSLTKDLKELLPKENTD